MSFPAVAASVGLASSYVAAIHLRQPPDLQNLGRNDPRVINHRFARVSALCLAITLILPYLLQTTLDAYPDYLSALRQLGLVPGFTNSHSLALDVANVLRSAAKMLVLYVGPVANYFVTNQAAHLAEDWRDAYTTIWGFRDHVFAPVSEELVYRAGVVAILQPYVSDWHITIYSPLLFGLAHVHHGFHLYHKEKLPPVSVAVQVLVQLAYTTVFGMLANRMYLATGENLWCAIVVHGMCNLFGFPTLDTRPEFPRWTYVYVALLVGGIFAFWCLL